MHVTFVSPLHFRGSSLIGGGERILANWARGLVEASGEACRVTIVSFGASTGRETLVPGVALRVLAAGPGGSSSGWSNRLDVTSWELPGVLAESDLVHVHQPFNRCGEFAILAASQQAKPICVTDHGGSSSSLGLSVGMLGLVDRVVPISDFAEAIMRARLSDGSGTDAMPGFETIKGGVDASFFTPAPKPVTRDRVLFVGRILPHKGIDQLIAALPPELPLTVFGCPYDEDYSRLLARLAEGKRVEFSFVAPEDGGDEVIRDLYRRAWVGVLPSVYLDCRGTVHLEPEHMGFTLLEAMACGTPALCSRVGGMPEFVRDGETGFVFDEPADLTHRLRQLAGDPALVERMGRRARHAIERDFDIRVVGRRLWRLYSSLLN